LYGFILYLSKMIWSVEVRADPTYERRVNAEEDQRGRSGAARTALLVIKGMSMLS
jgi:hypothetical protein